MKRSNPAAEKLDLVAATSGHSAITENGFSTKRLGIAFSALLTRSGLEPKTVEVTALALGCQPHQPCVQFVCCNAAGQSGAIIMLPMALFERLFVQIYGGDRVEEVSAAIGSAQGRFALRLGARLCEWLASAWPETAVPRLKHSDTSFEPSQQAEALNGFDSAMQLGVDVALPGAPSHQAQVMLASEILAARTQQQDKRQASNRVAGWQARLTERAGQVPLPVRSEIAVFSMPAARLLALKLGDVLPIAMPKVVPVLIGEQRFASASMGEWQGGAALRIESLNESHSV